MSHKKQSILQLTVLSIVIAISLLIGLVVYYDSLVTALQAATYKTLEEITAQEKGYFEQVIGSNKLVLTGFAESISGIVDDRDNLLRELDIITRSTDFESISFATPNGVAINSKGAVVNVSDRDYFHHALAGETVISEPIHAKTKDIYIIAAATPVIKEGEIIGVLIGGVKASNLNALFMSSFDGYGYTYIATNTGELIAKTENKYTLAETGSLFDQYKKAEFYNGNSYETMLENLIAGESGHAQYKISGQRRLLYYHKLPINDWNIFVIVGPDGIEKTANQILRNAILLMGGLVAVFILLLSYNLFSQKRFTAELTKMAYVDDVTGGRSFSKFKLDTAEILRQYPEFHFMLVKIDIENFKLVNELYAMEIGDQVLRTMAGALKSSLNGTSEIFGRIHADEFVVLLHYVQEEDLHKKNQQFEDQFAKDCAQLLEFKLVIPKGCYKLQKGETDFSQIYEKANFAHRLAKDSDNKNLLFDGKVKERAIWEKSVEHKMEQALQKEEFLLFLQPKYRLRDARIVGAEALVRWAPPNEPIIYPDAFIPIFEQNGFVTRLDFYMFEKVCMMLHTWIDGGIAPIVISVNFSRLHLSNPHFVEELAEIADRYAVPHPLLEIELTETTMLENLDVLEAVLTQLHDKHFTLSMDDFGSGYSSLGLLKNICVDVIKIDRRFFEQSRNLAREKTVVSSVIDMAKKLDIHTVAEGVETQAHIDLLRELGCETVQGFFFARPMPAEQLEIKLLRDAFLQ